MKTRYRITRRGSRGDTFYCVDTQTRKRTSLITSDLKAARRIVQAKNEAEQQPALNLQLAKAYLSGTDGEVNRRTWQEALVPSPAMRSLACSSTSAVVKYLTLLGWGL